MNDHLILVGDGHTVLSDEDRAGLIPSYIATKGELYGAEQRNISKARLRQRQATTARLLDDAFLRRMHRSMFEDVWTWAGQYRRVETNIGVEPWRIAADVRQLVDDARYWVKHATYDRDELALRFHHRLVFIHPFPNGSGRHGQIVADYLVRALGGDAFSWGALMDVTPDQLRAVHIEALRRADRGNVDELLAFARS